VTRKELDVDVKDVMKTDVVTVQPTTSLKEAARLLVAHRISGVPVVETDGTVVGVLSERDILFKESGAEEAHLLASLLGGAASRRAKLEAGTAGEAMTAPAITIQEWRSVAAAARTMLKADINRLPVVKRDRLVGIVTRADLVAAFVRPDDAIADEIRRDVLRRVLMLADASRVDVAVSGGEVTLRGSVDSRLEADAAVEVTRRVPGVVSVSSALTWEREAIAR
jgi:CBS domain-containing protein